MSIERVARADLDVATPIADFVDESLAGTGLDGDTFWEGVSAIIRDLTPWNLDLLARREELQQRIDAFHQAEPGQPARETYRRFLEEIGYIAAEPDEFQIETSGVDEEIAALAGPQLVVPLLNARFAVNAANARWSSLYDALYGTDAVSEQGEWARAGGYNSARGDEVVRLGRELLDTAVPLQTLSHGEVDAYRVVNGQILAVSGEREDTLRDPEQFIGFGGAVDALRSLLFVHHGLHIDVQLNRHGVVGRRDRAGIDDIVLESAVTTIMDLEDSVAAVDAIDKALGYCNWRDLMRGTLTARVSKGGAEMIRTLNPDRTYTAPDGGITHLRGRALMLVRNVGHLMATDCVRDAMGRDVQEGILDAVMTTLGAIGDLRGPSRGRNSPTGSLYIVKPKMHGPEEVEFTVALFERVEALCGLARDTLKIGIMDEERRTSVNLRATIHAARGRVAFINTGFLDRTGDEIRTSIHAGPMVPKSLMKAQPFMQAYESANVETGLRVGMAGRAQIGKGMWAMPDLMSDMLTQKAAHARSGATTAWVPSPTAATLHALHYHEFDAREIQAGMVDRRSVDADDLLVLPLADLPLDPEVVATELDDNVQSILGYVVRWVDQGIGCSKVPDIHGIARMEDRATLRISSQLLANWLAHDVISSDDIEESLHRMAGVVDAQNAADPLYEPLCGTSGEGLAFAAARRLIIEATLQTNGYTEIILHEARRAKKQQG